MACIFKAQDDHSVVLYFLYYVCNEEEVVCRFPEKVRFRGIESITALSQKNHIEGFLQIIHERIEGYRDEDKEYYLYECTLPDGEHCDYICGMRKLEKFAVELKRMSIIDRINFINELIALGEQLKFIRNSLG